MSVSYGELNRPRKVVIIGGGPAGVSCATTAARLGAEVTIVERRIIGGEAHLLDCVPSKAMIASGATMGNVNHAAEMGMGQVSCEVDLLALKARVAEVESRIESSTVELLDSQNVTIIKGNARLVSGTQVQVDAADGERSMLDADSIVLCTGSRPRVPDWVELDGDRILSTRDAYPPNAIPEHLIVVGSGVTGVEFVHMFNSFGSKVSLLVSRQQVLPGKDPEVASVLEDTFTQSGVDLYRGARAVGAERDGDGVVVTTSDGRAVKGTHVLIAIGSIPNSSDLGLEDVGIAVNEWAQVVVDHNCATSVPNIYAAGDLSGRLLLSSVASRQGRKIAEHAMGRHVGIHTHIDYDNAASAIFTDPEIADVGIKEAEAFAEGRKIQVTKVPFATSAKALINNDARGFVKIVSDPATGEVLGGSIVGRHAAELISVLALAVQAQLKVSDLADSLFVHPSLAESLTEAAE